MDKLKKDLEDAGFTVGQYSVTGDEPYYVVDVSGHPKQIGINRFVSLDWFNMRESLKECMEYFKKAKTKKRYDVDI